ncbi:MAG: radical SAM family heme chaperone HemW [Coprobacillus sp.]|nr:radical SAM family heme chaperone HemW [Coprobacillus sp.]
MKSNKPKSKQKFKKTKLQKRASSLYIHIPFCSNICFYCDFTKFLYNDEKVNLYLDNLEKELASFHITEKLKTIYVGGGTPSCLKKAQLERLLKILQPFSLGVKEYTFEANPESLDKDKIELLRKFGVNRISLGVQSTNDEILKSLNRKHNFDTVKEVVKNLNDFGLVNYSFDLILDLPGVSDEMLKEDINNLLALKPKHISCYSLEVHENTVFGKRGVKEVDEDTSYHHYEIVNEILEKHHFIHYEVSNWGKRGYFSRHNLVYWDNCHYFAAGISASSYIGKVRSKNISSLSEYNAGIFKYEEEKLVANDEMVYEIMMKLRTYKGLDDLKFSKKYGFSFIDSRIDRINEFMKNGYLEIKDDHVLVTTFLGSMSLNYVILNLIEEYLK